MENKNNEDSDSSDPDFICNLENDEDSRESTDSNHGNLSIALNSIINNKKHVNQNNQIKKRNIHTNLSSIKEKARADSLWTSFLSDTASPSKLQTDSSATVVTEDSVSRSSDLTKQIKTPNIENVAKTINTELKEVSPLISHKEYKKFTPITYVSDKSITQKRGISNVLSNINKKRKLSTLERSKLEWNQFKQENNLNEEISTFNRGRNGYLEKQDFLQRTDSRQFAIEKELRCREKRKI